MEAETAAKTTADPAAARAAILRDPAALSGVSGWRLVDQASIDAFANVTDDRQFIHVDPARASAEGPYGGPVAHGFLTLSLLPALLRGALPPIPGLRSSVNYGFDRVRFVAPVPAGARIRARFELRDAAFRGAGTLRLEWHVTVEIEGADRPALVADWIGLRHLDMAGETA